MISNYLLYENKKLTKKHQKGTAELCVLFAKEMKLSQNDEKILETCGKYHDIGKYDLPNKIINKPGSLTDQEREIIKRHPRLGFIRLLNNDELEIVRKIIVKHHEYSMTPYPRSGEDRRSKKRGVERRSFNEKIDLFAQILSLCDIYNALSSVRSYKSSFSRDKIFKIINAEFTGDKKLVRVLDTITKEVTTES